MDIPSLSRSSQNPPHLSNRLALLLILAAQNVSVLAALPKVDFARMGTVGLAGSFAGLDIFNASRDSTTFDPTTSTLLARASDGSLTALGSTSKGGKISSACNLDGKVYFAGSFSNVGSVSAQNVASYDPNAHTFSALGGDGGGVDGEVFSLFCDTKDNQLWVGGAFKAPQGAASSSYGGAVAVYRPKDNTWSPPPFAGLTGAAARVQSILSSTLSSSLLFSGSFLTSFQANTTQAAVSNPNVPFSSGATPFTSSLVPVSLANADLNAAPSSRSRDFNQINAILCPSGSDGPGNTWFAADGAPAVVTVRKYMFTPATGIRIGNTFLDGRGTKAFSFTTIPDNTLVRLTYIDPTTKQNVSCTSSCPLSNDPSILYQDFLFDFPDVVTGFQIKIDEWTGASAGLHLLQLLSDGAFASAVSEANEASCFAPNPSSVETTGQWTKATVFTDISGTTQNVLVSSAAVGSSPSSAPSLTWHPYISASGNYKVYMNVPGCQNMQNCGKRTSVKVTVFPGGGLQPSSTTVSEQVNDDTNQLIYTGPIIPTTPNFVSTVTLTLADQPTGTGEGGQYELVADRVQFVLQDLNTGANGTATTGSGGSGTSGFGFFEYPLGSSTTVNATAVLANSTLTALDDLALDLYTAIGVSNVASTPFSVNTFVPQDDKSVIFAGQFTLSTPSGVSNFAAYSGGSIVKVNEGGLNGVVHALVASQDKKTIWAGGAFTDTVDGNGQGRYRSVVRYDPASQTWSALGGGVDGSVSDLSLSADGKVLNVAGNFSHVLASPSNSMAVSGFAMWNIATNSWISSGGFLIGNMTMISDDSGYIAGNIQAYRQFGVQGWALLENGQGGSTVGIKSTGVTLGANVNGQGTPTARRVRRAAASASIMGMDWLPWMLSSPSSMFKRQSTAPPTLPAFPSTPAPAVLAGTFWTNSTSGKQVVVIGGNFSIPSTTPPASGVALYDSQSSTVTSLKGAQLNGTVRSLYVSGDTLFIGGSFALASEGGSLSGLAMYDLKQQSWLSTGSGQGLQGANVVVRSLTSAAAVPHTLIVAGSFTGAGSVTCEGVCSWNDESKQWTALGQGIKGEVATVDYAGSDSEILVIGGAITLADGTPANVAEYSFQNMTWKALGNTPGPVTALSVNNGNSSSIFAAGKSADGSSGFLIHWDGSTWTPLGDSWDGTSTVSDLRLVPLQDQHDAQGILENDRALMISGALSAKSLGSNTVSTALYDGQTFYPYITTSTADGSPGLVASLFHSLSTFSFSQRRFLATGIVILISIAIAAGIVFLMLLIGVLWTLCSRRETTAASNDDDSDDDSLRHGRPSSLLEHINAATRTTILGGAIAGAVSGAGSSKGGDHYKDVPHTATSLTAAGEPDASGWARSETPNDGLGAGMRAGMALGGDDPDDVNRPTQARYSFEAREEGELPLSSGTDVLVLNDRDPSWWYVRDVQSGREGVVPSSYLY